MKKPIVSVVVSQENVIFLREWARKQQRSMSWVVDTMLQAARHRQQQQADKKLKRQHHIGNMQTDDDRA